MVTLLPKQIVPSCDVQPDTRLKRSMLLLQKMADAEQDSLLEHKSTLPQRRNVGTSTPKQAFSQQKPQATELSGNFHSRKKASKNFKPHYVPSFSSFQGYQRSIQRAKQEKERKEAGQGKRGPGKDHKVQACR